MMCVFGGLSTKIVSTVKCPRLGQKSHIDGAENEDEVYADNSLHVLNLVNRKWYQPQAFGKPPSPRYGHTMTTLETVPKRIFLYGGRTKCNFDAALYVFNAEYLCWSSIEFSICPSGRHKHAMENYGDRIILYGGCGAMGLSDNHVHSLRIPSDFDANREVRDARATVRKQKNTIRASMHFLGRNCKTQVRADSNTSHKGSSQPRAPQVVAPITSSPRRRTQKH